MLPHHTTMSLFSSAFHSSPVAGPSTQLNHHYTTSAKPDKRKRPSIEKGPGEKDDQLRATQANLERLLSKVEKGDVKPKREGAEATGVSAEARKGKRNKRVGFKEDAIQEGKKAKGILALPNTEPRRTNMGLTKAGMGDGLVPQDEKKAWREVRANEKAQRKAKAKEIGIEVAVTSNPAPARLPPKRLIPASPRPENGAEEESLTEMQKGMKAKLEAARFR